MKDPTMVHALLWNMLAWFCWGMLVLFLRYLVERRHQQIRRSRGPGSSRSQRLSSRKLSPKRGKQWINATFSITSSSSLPTP